MTGSNGRPLESLTESQTAGPGGPITLQVSPHILQRERWRHGHEEGTILKPFAHARAFGFVRLCVHVCVRSFVRVCHPFYGNGGSTINLTGAPLRRLCIPRARVPSDPPFRRPFSSPIPRIQPSPLMRLLMV